MRKRVSRGSRPWVCRCDEPAVTGSVKEANERAACCGGRSYRGPVLVGRTAEPTGCRCGQSEHGRYEFEAQMLHRREGCFEVDLNQLGGEA